MSILNSNDYKRGFIQGKLDAQNGKDKSYIKSGVSLKFAIHGENAINTYIEGYNAGYLEGLKKDIPQKVEIINKEQKQETFTFNKNKQYFNNNFQNSNNMSLQRIELQLDALHQLKGFIHEFEEELKTRMSNYNDRVYALRQAGLPDEVSSNYDANYCIPTNSKIFQIIESMEQRDIPYISKLIADFEQAAENARLNY